MWFLELLLGPSSTACSTAEMYCTKLGGGACAPKDFAKGQRVALLLQELLLFNTDVDRMLFSFFDSFFVIWLGISFFCHEGNLRSIGNLQFFLLYMTLLPFKSNAN